MLNENAKKWVKALRSGEYKQGTKQLCKDDKFCCLGVACDLFSKEHPSLIRVEYVGQNEVYYNNYSSLLPEVVSDWLGLNSSCGMIDKELSLLFLNDSGTSFSDIADIIESDPEGLFMTPDEE